MKKFKKLVLVQIIVYLLVIVCMAFIYMGYSSSELRTILFALLIFALIYNVFLMYCVLNHRAKEKSNMLKNGKK